MMSASLGRIPGCILGPGCMGCDGAVGGIWAVPGSVGRGSKAHKEEMMSSKAPVVHE